MNASDVSFKRMLIHAGTNRKLAESASFMQVEFGIKELEACWDGFCDTSDNAGLTFENLVHVCSEFANALADYIEYICEPVS